MNAKSAPIAAAARAAEPRVSGGHAGFGMKSLWRRALAGKLLGAKSADRALPGGVATQACIAGKSLAAAPGRSAGRQLLYQPRAGLFAAAMPMTDFRDATMADATGFSSHITAPPAAREAVAAARPGVPFEWQNACSSTLPTPRRLGLWCSAALGSKSSISSRRPKNR
jgi:hypothetical protein